MASGTLIGPGCETTGGNATLRAIHTWESSTGNLADLSGIVFEVLCWDHSVSFENDVLPYMQSNGQTPNPTTGGVIKKGPFAIEPEKDENIFVVKPWLNGFEGQTEVPRWEIHASWEVAPGALTDNHSFSAPVSYTEGKWEDKDTYQRRKQFYVHEFEMCGEKRYSVLGTYIISHGSHASNRSFYISKGSSGEQLIYCSEWGE